jgi:hypothetical protein
MPGERGDESSCVCVICHVYVDDREHVIFNCNEPSA